MPFDGLTWINDRYNTTLSFKTHPQVFTFSILWNIFEREKCNNSFNPSSFKGFLRGKNLHIILTETDSILDFYKNRYVDNGQVNYKFRTLNLRNSDYPELVKNALLGNTIDLESKVLSIIISRFRNNLFHGLKNLAEICTQEPLFEINNSYISKLIERI